MPGLRFKCRICKVIMEHETIEEFEISPEFVVVQCCGCGIKGVESLVNELKVI